jgi:serine/threonine-protein kinase RsbW
MFMAVFSKTFLSAQPMISANVAEAIGWVRKQMVNEDASGSIEIVLAEALNNVVEHAYLYREDGQIEMNLALNDNVLHIQLADDGGQFPGIPQKRKMKGSAVRFEDLPEGGFGWFLIHSLTHSIHYEAVDGQNVVSFEILAPST